MTKPEIPVCPYCNSNEISIDVAASWDMEAQEWGIDHVFGSGSCQSCECEFKYCDYKPYDKWLAELGIEITAGWYVVSWMTDTHREKMKFDNLEDAIEFAKELLNDEHKP